MSQSLTAGSPWRVILAFTVPLLIGNAVQQLYQFVDTVVVGRHLGVDSLAAVGATGSFIFFLLGFAWGMTAGFAIPTAQAYGAQNAAAVRRSVATGAILTGIVSVLITAAAPFFSEWALRMLNTPEILLPEATVFTVISFVGTGATMFFNFLSAAIRAIGDSRTPLVFLVLACLLNVLLVVVFVAVLEWGVAGAALATVISQLVSVLLCLLYVKARLPELHLKREDWRITSDDVREHLRLGLPMGFQASIISIGAIAVQVRLNGLGADAVAAYTTAMRVDSLASAFLASLGLATSMFVAQNLGAGRPDRIRRGVVQAVWMTLIGSAALGAVMIAFGGQMVRLFVGDGAADVADLAFINLVINGLAYWILGVLFVLRGALQGLGSAIIPTITGMIELGMRVLAAVALGAVWGYVGVAWSNPLAWIGAVVVLVPAYLHARRALAVMPVRRGEPATDTTPIAVVGPIDGSRTVDAVVTQPIPVMRRRFWGRTRGPVSSRSASRPRVRD